MSGESARPEAVRDLGDVGMGEVGELALRHRHPAAQLGGLEVLHHVHQLEDHAGETWTRRKPRVSLAQRKTWRTSSTSRILRRNAQLEVGLDVGARLGEQAAEAAAVGRALEAEAVKREQPVDLVHRAEGRLVPVDGAAT